MNSAFDCSDIGAVAPVIDRERCVGDASCVAVCPHQVLVLTPVAAQDCDGLPASTRFLLSLSQGLQAAVVAPERCRACGLCLAVCSQHAITLQARGSDVE